MTTRREMVQCVNAERRAGMSKEAQGNQDSNKALLADFEIWWEREGNAMEPQDGDDPEAYAKRVSKGAWMNGAYKAKHPTPVWSDGDDSSPEFDPCDVCGGTEANFDGFCPQCELPMDVKPNNATTQNGGTR